MHQKKCNFTHSDLQKIQRILSNKQENAAYPESRSVKQQKEVLKK